MNDENFKMRIRFDSSDDAADALTALYEDEYSEGVVMKGRYLYLKDEAEEDAIARILEYADFDYEVEDWDGDVE